MSHNEGRQGSSEIVLIGLELECRIIKLFLRTHQTYKADLINVVGRMLIDCHLFQASYPIENMPYC